ncbi:MAG: Crp/Fnr family transcriptional regulator [Bacteroidota bacterium]
MEKAHILFKEFSDFISNQDIELAQPMLKVISFKQNDLLLKEGEVCTFIYFIIQGVALNTILEHSKERVVHASFEGEFSFALYSFYSQKPSEVYIRALTDMEVVGIDYKNVQILYDKSKNWERVGRIFAERTLIESLRAKYDIQHKTAHYRYNKLIGQRPEILQLLSLGQIADILGISQETLNRMSLFSSYPTERFL